MLLLFMEKYRIYVIITIVKSHYEIQGASKICRHPLHNNKITVHITFPEKFKYMVIYIEAACYGFLFEKNCEIPRKLWLVEVKNSLLTFWTGLLVNLGLIPHQICAQIRP